MAEREIPNRMTALGLLEQMRRSNANRQAPFDPVAASARERREAPRAPLFAAARPQAALPIPPRPPAVIPPQQTQQAAPQAAAAPQSRQRASNLPIPPTPPQLDEQGNPIYIPPALLPRTAGESGATYERFNPENPYVATATQMAEKYNLPPNVLLSMLYRESRFRPDAISPVGAIGIGQLMPGTAAELRVNPYNPTENIEGSARYLRQMLDLHKGDMPLALASYNAGPGRVRQAGNTIPSNKETQAYVPGVLRDAGVPGYAHGGLAHLEHKYAVGDLVEVPGVAAPIPAFDYHVRANRVRTPRTHRPAPREELTANQLNDMVLDRIAGRAAPAMEVGAPAEARERIGRTMGYDDGGLVQPHVSGGGSGTRVGNARIVGYGGTAGLDAQIGDGRLDTSITGQGMSSRAGGHHRQHHRIEGVNLGYTTPSGDHFTLGFHDRLMALPDTLPGANPMEVERGLSPSRGVRLGFRREFAEGGLADLHQKYADGGEVMSDEEYDRRLLARMKRDTGRTTESTNAEQAQALRNAGYDAAQLASDILLPQSPLDAALMVALGPGGRMARLAGSTALMAMEPSEAEAGGLRRVGRALAGRRMELPPVENSRLTQVATTGGTYEKARDVLRERGIEGPIIDYGAGRGHGSRILGGDSFEPYPSSEFSPTYTNPGDIPSDRYAGLVNLNVLNVLPPELRAEAVQNMGRVLRPEGTAIITTRGRDVMAARGTPGPEPMSLIIGEGDNARYQKGFTPRELREYLGETLGDRFDVENLALGPAGAVVRRLYGAAPVAIGASGLADLDQKYADGGIVSGGATPYDPDAVNSLANQIEAGYV